MKLKGIFLILVLGLLINSCKKENYPVEKYPLPGDTAIFTGTWNWIRSDHYYNWCDPPSSFEVITPVTINTTFSVQLISTGILYTYKNNSLIAEYRLNVIQFIDGDNICSILNSYKFGMELNGNSDPGFNGCINTDTLRLSSFPGFLFQSEPGCENYQNYFIKE